VPIKAKYFVPGLVADLYLGVSTVTFWDLNCSFCSRWWCIIWLLISWYWKKINLKTIVELSKASRA
jgi:hypothetical protein